MSPLRVIKDREPRTGDERRHNLITNYEWSDSLYSVSHSDDYKFMRKIKQQMMLSALSHTFKYLRLVIDVILTFCWMKIEQCRTNFKCYLLLFRLFSDMRSLIQQLESSEYSTIVYMFSNSSISSDDLSTINDSFDIGNLRTENFYGFCDVIASELSSLYQKNIIFWPCPRMMVSSPTWKILA